MTRNTKNTTENISENKLSSKNGQGSVPPPDDDEGLLKEILNYKKEKRIIIVPDIIRNRCVTFLYGIVTERGQ